jgi:fused signal recognition particle receptor
MSALGPNGIYVIGAIAFVVFLAVIGLIWRASKKRRAPIAPPPEPEKQRPDLKLVPPQPEAKPAPVEKAKALKEGLEKTRGGFISRIGSLLGKKQIDAALIAELEEILFTADIGAKTSSKLFEAVRSSLSRNELKDADAVWRIIRKESEAILIAAQTGAGAIDVAKHKPFVLLTIGVNGVGKTTTIGKLAAKWAASGKKVLLAAGDTFRAAATEQLEIWGQRANAPVVKGKEGGDPSSVIFDAVKRAQTEGFDIVIADTAGRLHTKTNLMEELQKVRRVLQKALPTAPHETFLVLDATNGQNAIAQASMFKQAMDITGIVLTKLDGTAKGGVILGICDELKVPVRYVGIGEKVDDLREFDPKEFVDALYAETESAA